MFHKFFLVLCFFALSLGANSLKISDLSTDLYSKKSPNTLKKIVLSLEIEGNDLNNNASKLYDAANTVVSGFFYEDLFTELGKLRFKETLTRYVNKKYKLKIDNVYILSMKSAPDIDINELRALLNESQKSENQKNIKDEKKENNSTNFNIAVPKVPEITAILNDASSGESNGDNLDYNSIKAMQNLDLNLSNNLILPDLNLPQSPTKTPIKLKDNNGFHVEIDESNSSMAPLNAVDSLDNKTLEPSSKTLQELNLLSEQNLSE